MKIYGQKEVTAVADVKCDICNEIVEQPFNDRTIYLYASFGYTSNHDTEIHECDMCENCYDKVKDFIEQLGGKIKVTDCG